MGSGRGQDPVAMNIADRFAAGAQDVRAVGGAENVDPRSQVPLRSKSGRARPQVVDIKGYTLNAADILSMDEAERLALLTKVKGGEMTIDEALNEVIEHKRRQNCSIM